MLMLLLTMALMVIFAAIIVPSVTFNIKRDREEEMVHRGVQYSRAIRAYYKKFNRYPMKIEDLENSNQMRFLRKRYKDPLTGKDFKLLHFGEAKMSMNALGGAGIAGAAALAQNGKLNTAGGLGQVSAVFRSGRCRRSKRKFSLCPERSGARPDRCRNTDRYRPELSKRIGPVES